MIFQCPVCNKSFASQPNLWRHRSNSHICSSSDASSAQDHIRRYQQSQQSQRVQRPGVGQATRNVQDERNRRILNQQDDRLSREGEGDSIYNNSSSPMDNISDNVSITFENSSLAHRSHSYDDDDTIPTPDSHHNSNPEYQHTFQMKEGENPIFAPPTKSRSHSHTINDACYLELLEIFNGFDDPPPLETFDKVMLWASKAYSKGFKFDANHPSRKTFLGRLKKTFKMEDHNATLVPTNVEGPEECLYTVRFNAKRQILSLLEDPSLMQPENLLINSNNPFHPYCNEKEYIDEILDGYWYKNTITNYKVNDFCIPIILYMDKTGGDKKNQRYPVLPLILTLGIFNRETRQHPSAWRHIGFFANDEATTSSAQRSESISKGGKCRNFHKQATSILDPFYTLQNIGLERILQIGSWCKRVRLFFPICCIMGDGQMGDTVCGRYENYSSSVKRIHRSCDCPGDKAADTSYQCTYLVQEEIEHMVERGDDASLTSLSQHMCQLSFFKADFGNCPFGVFGIQPPCLMHVLSEGIVEYLLDIFLDLTTSFQQSVIDSIVYPWVRGIRQSVRTQYPTCNFVTGVTGLSRVTADEKVGILFTMALLAASDVGRKALLVAHTNRHTIKLTEQSLSHYLHMFEGLLSLEQLLARGNKFWSLDNHLQGERRLSESIHVAVNQLINDCPRHKGNAWNLAKVHELMKFPRYISKLGSPSNYNAAIGESLLKPMAKHFLSTVQFRRETFLRDLSERVIEQDIIRFGSVIFNEDIRKKQMPSMHQCSPVHKSTKYDFSLVPDVRQTNTGDQRTYQLLVRCNSRSKKGVPELHSTIKDALRNHMISKNILRMSGYTQFRVDGQLYRAHPDYDGAGPWYDWAYLKFLRYSAQRSRNGSRRRRVNVTEDIPCKMLLFLQEGLENLGQEDYFALVHACEWEDSQISTLFSHRTLQYQLTGRKLPKYLIQPCNSIVRPAYCFEERPGFHHSAPKNKKVLVVMDRSKWSKEFS